MARYLSKAQAFKKTVRKPTQKLIQTDNGPVMQPMEAGIIALFQQGGATPDEVKIALERFQFKGLSERENPARRISVYDTDEQARTNGWSDELKAQIEKLLDDNQNSDYFRAEAPRLPIPWPNYPTVDPTVLDEAASAFGIDLEYVLAYERENLNRPEAIKTLEDAISVPDDEVVVAA